MHCSPYFQAYCYVICDCNLPVQKIGVSCTSKSSQNENLISCHISLFVLLPKEIPIVVFSIN